MGAALLALTLAVPTQAQNAEKPNILVIWGDDIGITDISADSHGMTGSMTPTLIINKPGYLINAQFLQSAGQLVISAEEFRAVLRRL